MSINKKRLLVFLFPLLLSLPFLNRAYFVDDHFFVEIADWIKDHPTQPYNFPTEGLPPPTQMSGPDLSARIVNPLLHHYYLAALIKIGGEREWWLRFGCVLISCFSALLIFELAHRFLRDPLWGTLLVLVTPVFWLTSYSLLIDATLGFFFLAALTLFVRGGDSGSPAEILGSGVCIGLALLTKYTGLLIVPVTMVWLALNWKTYKGKKWAAVTWVVGLSFLVAYDAYTRQVYGASHLKVASGLGLSALNPGKLLSLLVFLSGGTIAALGVWLILRWQVVLVYALATVAGIFFFIQVGLTPMQSALLVIWFLTSLALVFQFVSLKFLWQPVTDLFLFLWLGGFLSMMALVMPWVAVRYYVMAAPAAVFLVVRLVEMVYPAKARWMLPALVVFTGLVAAGVGYADYQQAESGRWAARELPAQGFPPAPRTFYFAEDFTNTYFRKAGYPPLIEGTVLKPGDRIIVSDITLPASWFLRRFKADYQPVYALQAVSGFPVKVMDGRGGAGFYASAWGPLPFSLNAGPWERFIVFEVKR